MRVGRWTGGEDAHGGAPASAVCRGPVLSLNFDAESCSRKPNCQRLAMQVLRFGVSCLPAGRKAPIAL